MSSDKKKDWQKIPSEQPSHAVERLMSEAHRALWLAAQAMDDDRARAGQGMQAGSLAAVLHNVAYAVGNLSPVLEKFAREGEKKHFEREREQQLAYRGIEEEGRHARACNEGGEHHGYCACWCHFSKKADLGAIPARE